ncbi:MAG: M67 family metallopeptidase [Nitrososphaerota archaeon]|nr:M67 family metallopeptidase [Nitrososphaerota archaeon]MDG7039528.1 M67 family metallopeptidase [Nitrososphaerota archaeon]MDG7043172.1 M67 family metallopeptidase [Nitrososphaerota archaeon]
MLEISFRQGAVDDLLKYAKGMSPLEAVAFLLGVAKGDQHSVSEIRPVNNADKSAVSFSVAPQELYDVYVLAEKAGLSIVGLFHSHPASPYPSTIDMNFMKMNPFVWVIASSIDWRIGAFILTGSHIASVKIIRG